MNEVPVAIEQLFNDLVKIKHTTNLQTIDQVSLEQWYFTKKVESLNENVLLSKLTSIETDLDAEIGKEQEELSILQKYIQLCASNN